MRIQYMLLILLTALASCTKEKTNFTVKCQIDAAENQQIYLARLTLSGNQAVDSALPDKSGKYLLEGYTQIPDFFILYFQEDHYVNLIIHPGDNIIVEADANTIDYQYFIEGSVDSRLVQKMVSRQAVTLREITDISMKYENSMGSPDFENIKAQIDSSYERIVEEHRRFSIELIEENPASLASLMALYQQLGRNIPVFDYKDDLSYFKLVDSSLTALYPDSEAVKDLNKKITEIQLLLQTDIGSVAPDIVMTDTSGTSIPLSSLRGNYVLLYFWASWSPESLDMNKDLSSQYSRYAMDDLEYYQVSLDRTRDSWIRSIRDQHPAGLQVSDLKYWNSPAVESYMIEELPQIYLLDKQGRIVDKDFEINEFTKIFLNLLSGETASGSTGIN